MIIDFSTPNHVKIAGSTVEFSGPNDPVASLLIAAALTEVCNEDQDGAIAAECDAAPRDAAIVVMTALALRTYAAQKAAVLASALAA